MRLAVISLPLHANYGGVLQSYALKSELERMGHSVTVIDRKVKMPFPRWWKAPFVYLKRAMKSDVEVFREYRFRNEYPVVCRELIRFIEKEIAPRMVGSYCEIGKGDFDGFVVGSDQVWRPRYFGRIEDAFLGFTKGWDVRRVAYAASFGTGQLEFDSETMRICADLLSCFDGISVREADAVKICDEWLDCDNAVHVLDPVMLMDVSHLERIASEVSERRAKGKVMTYILDPSDNKRAITGLVSRWSDKDVEDFSIAPYDKNLPIGERMVPPVQEWIAGFADADFVVTDSFHGCVLSILFHKPFIAVGNGQRGMSRMSSLLEMFGLDSRLVHGIDPEDDGTFFLSQPDWEAVDNVLEQQRTVSRDFLENVLK